METHVLKLRSVELSAKISEKGQMVCEWNGRKLSSFSIKRRKEVLESYILWRDGIMQAWADKHQLTTMCVTPMTGYILVTTYVPGSAPISKRL